MFPLTSCKEPTCHMYAATGSEYCFRHSPDREEIQKKCIEDLLSEGVTRNWCITGAEFGPGHLPEGKSVEGSNFAWCTFRRIDFSHVKIVSSFFDFCLFDECVFRDIDCRYSVFAGSKMYGCDFSGSFIVQSNFAGIDAYGCDFSSCDLYFSTFASSYLSDTRFEDDNLNKTDFRFSDRRRVSFRLSNVSEAALS